MKRKKPKKRSRRKRSEPLDDVGITLEYTLLSAIPRGRWVYRIMRCKTCNKPLAVRTRFLTRIRCPLCRSAWLEDIPLKTPYGYEPRILFEDTDEAWALASTIADYIVQPTGKGEYKVYPTQPTEKDGGFREQLSVKTVSG